ncbi:hypothetical protein Dsin_032047 [Dipteronia sinensis]|uniref:CCHC-type domain-containing protein n=1 Tax=Dipteronia sinensis TaxID=43782 RepID=A0AAD9ZM60_9ROSI|nr:hypothetical protein Dsin_032047 [Dipteronia sinensis]
MNLEDIARRYATMSLVEKERPVQCLKDDLKMGVEIEIVKNNFFLFHFKTGEDRCWVLAGGPWTFDGDLIMLEMPTGRGEIENMRFNLADFWVQIHCVPLLCMTKEIGQFLEDFVGNVLEVDMDASGDWVGKFLRIRILLDVEKPLRRWLRVDVMRDGVETPMILKYEQLPNHCFLCGHLGHPTRECPEGVDTEKDLTRVEEMPFGPWLKAALPEIRKRLRSRKWNNNSARRGDYSGVSSSSQPCLEGDY